MSSFAQQRDKVRDRLRHCKGDLVEQHLALLCQSDFIVDALSRYPAWLEILAAHPPTAQDEQNYVAWLDLQMGNVTDEASLLRVLRQFRRQMLVRIAWSQLTQTSQTEDSLAQLSHLAELLVITARDWLYQLSCQEWGTPCNREGVPQPLLILGMGKLGGGELNFSSDIDLIFTFPESGSTQGGRRELDNAVFFTRLGQRIIKALDSQTEEGFVYRVDMRLRPLGDGGPLVLSFAAMEDYYQEQGRDWERYAMVKAKILGENTPDGTAFYQMVKPFVFRRYIDFSVLQSLRNMKGMIEREVRRRGLHNNIKLGAGGIREIEFIVQVFQLIRGGRVPALQTRSLLTALTVIEQEQLLPSEEIALLHDNYLYLRRVENILQAINDEQTQTLPEPLLDQARLAHAMHFNHWSDFVHDLNLRMAANRTIFSALIGEPEEGASLNPQEEKFAGLWVDDLDISDIQAILPTCDSETARSLGQLILQFKADMSKRTIGVRGRDILDQLMVKLFAVVCPQENCLLVLPRLTHLLLNIVSRTTYLELLVEYPVALEQLVRLCAASPMISEQLARYPLLLDELIDINTLYETLPAKEYRSQLYQYLLRIPVDDEEQQLEALRQFKQMQLLHIGAADVAGVLPIMKVSDHLTFLAEAMVDFVVQLAWNQMVVRYGQPAHLTGEDKGLVVIGYGKLGGWELGYSSDLDLVFLHDCPADSLTNGDKVIDSRQFYLRLVQRVIHLFNVRTNSGILYEVDVRLRPQGDAGLLACTLAAFYDYQASEAWTWEHQALVRARAVYGQPDLITQFNTIRHQILALDRPEQTLKRDVREMREKMRAHLGSKKSAHQFDIKIDAGGIGDIEFIAQYLVLNYAHHQPELTYWSDNVRIFDLMSNYQIMPITEASKLKQAYIEMRNEMHQRALQLLSSKVDDEAFTTQRQWVEQSWQKWLAD